MTYYDRIRANPTYDRAREADLATTISDKNPPSLRKLFDGLMMDARDPWSWNQIVIRVAELVESEPTLLAELDCSIWGKRK
jgi:hypothetical protein